MKKAVVSLIAVSIVLVALSASAALFGQSLLWLHVGGTAKNPKATIDEEGHATFVGGIDAYGAKLRVPSTLFRDATQVGALTGGLTDPRGAFVFNGSIYAMDTSDFESPSGYGAVMTDEDLFGYGERPLLSLGGADGEGLRLHYDLDHTVDFDVFDSSADTVLRFKNSDGSHKLSGEFEGSVSGESLAITKGATINNLQVKDWSAGSTWAEIKHKDNANAYVQFRSSGEVNIASAPSADLTFLPGNDALKASAFDPATGKLILGDDLKVNGHDVDIGDSGGFSGLKFNAGSTTLDFYIDGVKVRHINADGSATDDVP